MWFYCCKCEKAVMVEAENQQDAMMFVESHRVGNHLYCDKCKKER